MSAHMIRASAEQLSPLSQRLGVDEAITPTSYGFWSV
jgi:hypothetical protein